jgi:hypothetical protein
MGRGATQPGTHHATHIRCSRGDGPEEHAVGLGEVDAAAVVRVEEGELPLGAEGDAHLQAMRVREAADGAEHRPISSWVVPLDMCETGWAPLSDASTVRGHPSLSRSVHTTASADPALCCIWAVAS